MTKNVLITGGSRGIGFGMAIELAKAGCNLAINGVREEEQVSQVLKELRSFNTEIIYCQGDVSSVSDLDNIINETLDKFKRINVLINNAGVGPKERVDLLEMKTESYDRVMGINLRGPFFLTQKVANHMIANKKDDSNYEGCIINMSSISANTVSINRGEYCISKAGMSMMTKLFAVSLGAYDIPVYEVQPGIIETDMTAAVRDKYQKLAQEGLIIQSRLGVPEEIGKAVCALIENRIPYATGQVLKLDGGLSIPRL